MFGIPLLAQAIGAVVIFVAGMAGGVKWHAGIVAARDLKAVQETARVQILRADKVDQSAVRHEATKAKIETVYATITKEVERVVEKPVYRNICIDDDGLRVVAQAIAATNTAAGFPSPALSAPARPD